MKEIYIIILLLSVVIIFNYKGTKIIFDPKIMHPASIP